ncbi:MAG: hypothetical protein V4493_03005 [Pseudomonadota bacterium]
MPILSLVLANWKPILLAVAFFGWSYAAYSHGEAHTQAKWDEATIEAQKQQEASKVKLQAIADKASREYEANAAKQKVAIAALNRRLKNEISTNAALRSCVFDGNFLSLYNSAAGIGDSTP